MMNKILSLILLFLMTGTLMAQHPAAPQPTVTQVMLKELTDVPAEKF